MTLYHYYYINEAYRLNEAVLRALWVLRFAKYANIPGNVPNAQKFYNDTIDYVSGRR